MRDISSLLQQAQALDRAGKQLEAEASLLGSLDGSADHADAWSFLADLQIRLGKFVEATESFRSLVRLRPDDALAQNRLAIALARQGRLDEAIAQLRNLISSRPDDAAAHHNLGVALAERKAHAEAVASFERAVQLAPDYQEAHHQLANALRSLGKLVEAERSYRTALALAPRDAGVMHDLGTLLAESRRPGAAEPFLRQVCRLRPDWIDAHNDLGLALMAEGQYEAAKQSFECALRIDPHCSSPHSNLATAYMNLGHIPQALAAYDIALLLEPSCPSTHWNRALALLKGGDYERGWFEYEWRWRRPASPPRQLPKPMWDGSDLAGRTIFLHGEQGLGDTLQFVRYANLIKQRGAGKVVLECGWPIAAVVQTCPGIDELVLDGSPLPDFDVHLPLLSAPSRLRTTMATVPSDVPYLHPEPQRIAQWRKLLEDKVGSGLKVGLYWQGNPHFQHDRFRGIKLEMFGPLSEIAGVEFISLQRGPGADQLDRWGPIFGVHEITSRQVTSPQDWADTAAIMKNLDMVVTSCTAAAHLAGALAVSTWILVSAAADWRWLLERCDSPWYPTARLFRQEKLGEWEPVVQRIARGLAQLVA